MLGVVPTLAELDITVGEERAGLLNEVLLDSEIDQAALWQPDCFSGSENSPGRFSSTPPLILPVCRYPLAIRRGAAFWPRKPGANAWQSASF